MPIGRCCPHLGQVSLEWSSQTWSCVSKTDLKSRQVDSWDELSRAGTQSIRSSPPQLYRHSWHEQWTCSKAVAREWSLFTLCPSCQINQGQRGLQMNSILKFHTICWDSHCWQLKGRICIFWVYTHVFMQNSWTSVCQFSHFFCLWKIQVDKACCICFLQCLIN